MKEVLALGSQLQGEVDEGGILWWLDDAFAHVMGGGHVWGVGFGPTPFGTHMRNMEDCMPPPTSTATDQRVKELTTEVVELREKCSCVESLKAEVMMMRKIFSQLNPVFTISHVKSLNSICHIFYNLDLQQYLQCCQGILRYRWIAQNITNCTTNIDSICRIEIYIVLLNY